MTVAFPVHWPLPSDASTSITTNLPDAQSRNPLLPYPNDPDEKKKSELIPAKHPNPEKGTNPNALLLCGVMRQAIFFSFSFLRISCHFVARCRDDTKLVDEWRQVVVPLCLCADRRKVAGCLAEKPKTTLPSMRGLRPRRPLRSEFQFDDFLFRLTGFPAGRRGARRRWRVMLRRGRGQRLPLLDP